MSKNGLGKGFEGLIPTGFSMQSVIDSGEVIKKLEIEKIVTNPDQPRKIFDEELLRELAQSIKEHGVIQPLIVTPYEGGYRIVAGERRYRAAKIAKQTTVPVVIRNHAQLEEIEIALIENVQRVDLSPLEQAVSILKLKEQFSLSPKEIAKKLGKAETTISNIVRLLQLTPNGIEALKQGSISEGHARALLALKQNGAAQDKLLNEIVQEKYSVRDAENWVKKWKIENEQKNSSISQTGQARLAELKTKGYDIKVQEKKRGGVVLVSYKTKSELENLLNKL